MIDAKTALANTLAGAQALSDAVSERDAALAAANDALAVLNATVKAQAEQIAALQAQLGTTRVLADTTGKIPANAGFQAAIDRCPAGGTVIAGAGTYLIDATHPLMVKAGITLDLTDATLQVQPNAAPRYYVLRVASKAVIKGKGGHLIGDRLAHTYTSTSTSTHEWGYGIMVDGDDVVIQDLLIEQFTGDGIGVTGNRATIQNVTSTRNRRQGLSVFSCAGLRVSDSEFSATGAYLTSTAAPFGPCAGVDLEPDSGSVTDAQFTRCSLIDNRVGLLAWLRAEVTGTLGFTLTDCIVTGNANGVWTKDAGMRKDTIHGVLAGNHYASTKGSAIKADAGSVLTANGETFAGIASKYAIAQVNGGVVTSTGSTFA